MEKTIQKLLDKLGKKGFDTEKKVNAIDMQAAYDNGLTDDLGGILALQKAIKTHSTYAFIMGGTDAKPAKKTKEETSDADDDRTGESNAASFICMHVHPSGSLTPSIEDKDITRRLMEAGDILGIRMLDHLIVAGGSGRVFSFRNEGLLDQLKPKSRDWERC